MRLTNIDDCDRELFYKQCGGKDSLITVEASFNMLMALPIFDLDDHDKQIRNATIDEMKSNLIKNSRTEVIDYKIQFIVTEDRIKLIAEQMKGES